MTATLNVRDVLPYQFHSIFPYPKFNEIQSIVFSHAYQENKNLIVAAPSGSGRQQTQQKSFPLLTVNLRKNRGDGACNMPCFFNFWKG